MGKTLWIAGVFTMVWVGTACAQNLPSLDTGESTVSYTIPSLPLAPGVAPEPIGGSRAGTVQSSPVIEPMGGDGADVLIGVTSAVDVSAEGALMSSQGPGRGLPGASSSSSWTVSGFGASSRASAANQRVSGSLASSYGQSSRSSSAESTYTLGRGVSAGPQASGDMLSGESFGGSSADSSAMSSNRVGDIPDMTMPAYSPGAGSGMPSGSGFSGSGSAGESSIQTPGFSFDQYGIGSPGRAVSAPGRLASQRHRPMLHDRASRLGSGSALKSRTRLATTKRVRDR